MKRTTQIYGKQLSIQTILSPSIEAAKVLRATCKESGINEQEMNGEFPQNKHCVRYETREVKPATWSLLIQQNHLRLYT
jgi:hypothetical protein